MRPCQRNLCTATRSQRCQAETEAAFHLAFYVAELTGQSETSRDFGKRRTIAAIPDSGDETYDGKQSVMVASEVLETFGGAGYVEDTGLPVLLRDSQVLPIWEGTTNVLALDTLRALTVARTVWRRLSLLISSCLENVQRSASCRRRSCRAIKRWTMRRAGWRSGAAGPPALEAGARRFSLTLGRTMELALLIKHAQWSQDHECAKGHTVRPPFRVCWCRSLFGHGFSRISKIYRIES